MVAGGSITCVRAAPSGDPDGMARLSDDRARRLLPTVFAEPARQGGPMGRSTLGHRQPKGEFHMPIILWLLGVPLTIIVLLMLFNVL